MTLYCRGLQTFFMPQMYVFPWRCSLSILPLRKKSSIVDFSSLCAGTCVLVQGSPEKFIFDFLEVTKEHLAQLASALEVHVSLLKGAIDERSGEKWLGWLVQCLPPLPLSHSGGGGAAIIGTQACPWSFHLRPPIAARVCVCLCSSLPGACLLAPFVIVFRAVFITQPLVVTYSFIREDCFSSSWVQDLIPGCVHCFSVFVVAHTSQGLCNTTQI